MPATTISDVGVEQTVSLVGGCDPYVSLSSGWVQQYGASVCRLVRAKRLDHQSLLETPMTETSFWMIVTELTDGAE